MRCVSRWASSAFSSASAARPAIRCANSWSARRRTAVRCVSAHRADLAAARAQRDDQSSWLAVAIGAHRRRRELDRAGSAKAGDQQRRPGRSMTSPRGSSNGVGDQRGAADQAKRSRSAAWRQRGAGGDDRERRRATTASAATRARLTRPAARRPCARARRGRRGRTPADHGRAADDDQLAALGGEVAGALDDQPDAGGVDERDLAQVEVDEVRLSWRACSTRVATSSIVARSISPARRPRPRRRWCDGRVTSKSGSPCIAGDLLMPLKRSPARARFPGPCRRTSR